MSDYVDVELRMSEVPGRRSCICRFPVGLMPRTGEYVNVPDDETLWVVTHVGWAASGSTLSRPLLTLAPAL